MLGFYFTQYWRRQLMNADNGGMAADGDEEVLSFTKENTSLSGAFSKKLFQKICILKVCIFYTTGFTCAVYYNYNYSRQKANIKLNFTS